MTERALGESVENSLAYYANNAGVTLNLIRACLAGGVTRFVYSSTAALGWQPRHDDLLFIVRTALAWERRLMARRNPALTGP